MIFRPTFARDWRLFRRLSQERLAGDVGVSKATISRIENGKQGYTQPILEALAEALQCDPADLLMRRPGENELYRLVLTMSPAEQEQAARILLAMRVPLPIKAEDADDGSRRYGT